MPVDEFIFGQGIYTPREAARLVGVTAQDILRWTRGSGSNEPLWHGHFQDLDDATEINFSDLIEARVVRALRKAGASMQAVRFALKLAKHKFSSEYPLSSLGFKTDGKEILIDALERDGELLSLSSRSPGQKVFKRIVSQSLNDLEYEDGEATLWRPRSTKTVVIDQKRSFGTPIIEEYGISTATLYSEFLRVKDTKIISKIYEIPKSVIQDAISFEKKLDLSNSRTNGRSSF